MANKSIVPITRLNKSYQLYGLYCPFNEELKYIGIRESKFGLTYESLFNDLIENKLTKIEISKKI